MATPRKPRPAFRSTPVKPEGGRLVHHHTQPFALWVPHHMLVTPEGDRAPLLGRITLHGNPFGCYPFRCTPAYLAGTVPASWLVDLNADSAVTVEHDAPEEPTELW